MAALTQSVTQPTTPLMYNGHARVAPKADRAAVKASWTAFVKAWKIFHGGNLFLQSENLAVTWVNTRTTDAINVIPGPTLTSTGDKLIENGDTDTHFIAQSITTVSGLIYTMATYVQPGERTQLRLDMATAGFPANTFADFDLTAIGTVLNQGAGASSSTISLNSRGWIRCSVTATADASAATSFGLFLMNGGAVSYAGDSSSGLHLWGMQLTLSSGPVIYTATTTTAATGSDPGDFSHAGLNYS